MSNIRNSIIKFLDKYGLTKGNQQILVGFSGGFDSLCLLDNLYQMGINSIAIHLNHNWRGQESLHDCEFCKQYCEERNIPFYTETLTDEIPHTETAARCARYEFFEHCAKQFNAKAVLTAHNADDNAETVLYRIIKGTGTEGLTAISEHRGIFYRPLLGIKRDEIENYCKENRLTPNIDSSNSNTNYKRNFIRLKIMPLIKEINHNASTAINSLSTIAAEENEILNEYIKQISDDTKNFTPKFILLSQAVQNRIIYNLFRANNLDYDRETILKVVEFIKMNSKSKSGKTLSITTDLWLFASSEKFEFITASTKSSSKIQITHTGDYEFDNYIFSIQKCENLPEKFPSDKENMAYVSLNDINFTLRYRQDGDIIRPLGSFGSQKLKKYFNSKKIPNNKKNLIPILCIGKEVLWAAGYGLSETIKITNHQLMKCRNCPLELQTNIIETDKENNLKKFSVENSNIYMLKLTHKNEGGYGN